MSITNEAHRSGDKDKTIGSSVAPFARVSRRLKIAARVLNSLERPPEQASLALVHSSGAPELRAVEQKITIGRAATADWLVEDPALSRNHFELLRSKSGVVLRDLKSHNGTRVNEAACAERCLADGDLIQAGRQTFVFLAGLNTALAK